MKILALDTGTEALSLALRDGPQVYEHASAGGAAASATLLPAIQALMARAGLRYGQLDAIAFGCGPGSFTGLRTACSVAQGLAFGAGIPVLPVDSLMAVAEDAREACGARQVLALLDARMGEVYAARYLFTGSDALPAWTRQEDFQLLDPRQLRYDGGWTAAGNVFHLPGIDWIQQPARVAAIPRAQAMLRLAPALLAAGHGIPADQALPRYIRDKVAKTTDERDAERAAKAEVLP